MKTIQNLRALGHNRLLEWAPQRAAINELVGSSGLSATEKMRLQAQGGGPSTSSGNLNQVEMQAVKYGRVLQVDRAVRDLPVGRRAAVEARYLGSVSLSDWARANGKTPNSVIISADRGTTDIGRVLSQWLESKRGKIVQEK